MRNALETLDQGYLEMRWRVLSLAADLDRIERAPGGKETLANDPRLKSLREAIRIVGDSQRDRAARVQMLLSDASKVTGS